MQEQEQFANRLQEQKQKQEQEKEQEFERCWRVLAAGANVATLFLLCFYLHDQYIF